MKWKTRSVDTHPATAAAVEQTTQPDRTSCEFRETSTETQCRSCTRQPDTHRRSMRDLRIRPRWRRSATGVAAGRNRESSPLPARGDSGRLETVHRAAECRERRKDETRTREPRSVNAARAALITLLVPSAWKYRAAGTRASNGLVSGERRPDEGRNPATWQAVGHAPDRRPRATRERVGRQPGRPVHQMQTVRAHHSAPAAATSMLSGS